MMTQPQPTLDALNAETSDHRLDGLLHEFFRMNPTASTAARGRKRRRPHEEESATRLPMDEDAALKALKGFLRDSREPRHIDRVYQSIVAHLQRAKRVQGLLSRVVRLCAELFARSAALRGRIATQAAGFFDRLLEAAGELSGGSQRLHRARRSENAIPQSPELEQVLGLIEEWTEEFGSRYPTIAAGQRDLQERGYVFPRVRARRAEAAAEVATREAHQRRIMSLKVDQMQLEMARIVPEMESVITEANRICEILVPTLDAFILDDDGVEVDQTSGRGGKHEETRNMASDGLPDNESKDEEAADIDWEDATNKSPAQRSSDHHESDDDGDVEWEDVGPDAVEEEEAEEEQEVADDQDDEDSGFVPHHGMDINEIVEAYGLGSSSYQLTISIPTSVCEESAENEVLFRNLTDAVLEIRKRFVPLVDDWLGIMGNDDDHNSGTDRNDEGRRNRWCELTELRRRLEQVAAKWADLVKESERKRFARVQSTVVSLPVAAYDAQRPALRISSPSASNILAEGSSRRILGTRGPSPRRRSRRR